MSYKKVGWEDSPSSNTPILSVSLNQMDDGIEKANKGIVFGYSATFTADNVLKNTTSTEALGSGSFATSQTDIVTVFVADNVTKINNGAFSGCTSLKTIYIDNTVGNVDIVSGAVPSGVSIVYSDDENFINVNELLASAIKSLKSSVNANRTDWENRATTIEQQASSDKTELSQTIQKVKESALEEFASVKADVSTNEKSIESLKADKLDKADFNTYKSETDTAINANASSIAEKFDRTNVENGTGNIYMQNSEIAGTFSYFKVGDLVVLQLNVSNLPTNVGYLYCFGLPFRAKDSSNLYRSLVTTNTGDMIKIAIQDNHIHLSLMTGNFKEGCIITTTVSYLI